MAYAVELNLSADSAGRVIRLWERLADASINSVMLDMGGRPHISLAVFEELAPPLLEEDLSRFAKMTGPFSVALWSAGVFPDTKGVVFLAPAVTQELLEIHRRFYAFLEVSGLECQEYYRPGRWVPHCTVATEVLPDRVGAAIELCVQSEVFGPVMLDEVSLVEFRPVREIYAFPLRSD
ncbi:MAG: 2'-5' RNA ligase family protein [Anaerolineae bacterium]|nr:2'-5' RNA ligase family protein [Anaerolineae bacterium]